MLFELLHCSKGCCLIVFLSHAKDPDAWPSDFMILCTQFIVYVVWEILPLAERGLCRRVTGTRVPPESFGGTGCKKLMLDTRKYKIFALFM